MQQNFHKIKRYTNWILDFVLGVLGLLIVVFMLRHLYDISTYIIKPMSPANFSVVMQEVISFFMLFEFIMMILRYIQEGHHIPIRYLILICITAILRQVMVIHGEGLQTLLLALSILLLVVVLYVLGLNSSHFFMAGKTKYEEEKAHEQS
jgi:protein PsiE